MLLEPADRALDRRSSAAVIGLFAGLSAQGRWDQWLLFRNGGDVRHQRSASSASTSASTSSSYPFWRYLLGLGFTAGGAVGARLAGRALPLRRRAAAGRRRPDDQRGAGPPDHAWWRSSCCSRRWRTSWTGAAMLLEYNESAKLYGAGYADINALLPAKEILAYISIVVAIAIIVFSNAVMRNLVWPGISLALLGISAVAIGGIYPWAVQTFEVKPSAKDKEAPYIQRSIEATRQAFGLDDTKVTPYAAQQPEPPATLATDTTVVAEHPAARPAARLRDVHPAPAGPRLLRLRREARHRPLHRQRQDPGLRRRRPRDQLRRAAGAAEQLDQPAHRLHPRVRLGRRPGQPGRLRRPAVLRLRLPRRADQGAAAARPPSEQIPAEQPRIYYGEQMGPATTRSSARPAASRQRRVRPAAPATAASSTTPTPAPVASRSAPSGRRLLYAIKEQETNFLLSERGQRELEAPLRAQPAGPGREGRAVPDRRRRPVPGGRRRPDQVDHRRLHDGVDATRTPQRINLQADDDRRR